MLQRPGFSQRGNVMTDKRAPGEGADNDAGNADFGGPTVRTPEPPSFVVRAIGNIQNDITGRRSRVVLDDEGGEAVPSGEVVDATMPNSGPVALPPPPVAPNLPEGGVLGDLGEEGGHWAGEKVQSFLDILPTTPLPRDPRVVMAAMPTTQVVVARPIQQAVTLAIGPIPSPVADSATMPCAQDRDGWVRLALALKSAFDAQVPGAVDVVATSLNPLLSLEEFRRDSLVICVLDRKRYGDLLLAESDIRRSRQVPADLKKALLLVWADMRRLLVAPARCLRVRGQVDGDVICEVERGFVPMQVQASSATSSYLLIALVALALVGAGVLTVMVL